MLLSGIAWYASAGPVTDRGSLLYNVIAGEEVVEGPLDPSAYASANAPGIGGARLAALDANAGIELTFADPEVQFANTITLGGNVIIAPLSPIEPEPGSEGATNTKQNKAFIYTVEEGDTIASIAAAFNISTNTVLWANGLSGKDVIAVGDHLTILPTTGVLHTVKSGDTLLALANHYRAETADIISYNGLSDAAKLSIGQKLIIPDGYVAPRTTPRITNDAQIATGPTPPSVEATGPGLLWPTTTKHISQYFKWGHTGIDIDNRSRPAIYAAAAGTVEFAGRLGGYGNLLIINHGNGLQTYYAHNELHYVSKGETVTKGQAIAKMGSTGRSTGPHVHFEVRKNGTPQNPLNFL